LESFPDVQRKHEALAFQVAFACKSMFFKYDLKNRSQIILETGSEQRSEAFQTGVQAHYDLENMVDKEAVYKCLLTEET
jgi:elongation factor P hydroxylase